MLRTAYLRAETAEAVRAALDAWLKSRPLLLRLRLPVWVQRRLFGLFGRRFADDFMADWLTERRQSRREELEGLLDPSEFEVRPVWLIQWMDQLEKKSTAQTKFESDERRHARAGMARPQPNEDLRSFRVGFVPGCTCSGCRQVDA